MDINAAIAALHTITPIAIALVILNNLKLNLVLHIAASKISKKRSKKHSKTSTKKKVHMKELSFGYRDINIKIEIS